MDSGKVEVRHSRFGKGVFAIGDIDTNEVIAEFDGPEFIADRISILEQNIRDHAIQIANNRWRDSVGLARYLNHSCNPNCGIRGIDTIVAMTRIGAGEELLLDYEMTERSDWQMICQCGCPDCRHIISTYNNLPLEKRQAYKGYISTWIENEHLGSAENTRQK